MKGQQSTTLTVSCRSLLFNNSYYTVNNNASPSPIYSMCPLHRDIDRCQQGWGHYMKCNIRELPNQKWMLPYENNCTITDRGTKSIDFFLLVKNKCNRVLEILLTIMMTLLFLHRQRLFLGLLWLCNVISQVQDPFVFKCEAQCCKEIGFTITVISVLITLCQSINLNSQQTTKFVLI